MLDNYKLIVAIMLSSFHSKLICLLHLWHTKFLKDLFDSLFYSVWHELVWEPQHTFPLRTPRSPNGTAATRAPQVPARPRSSVQSDFPKLLRLGVWEWEWECDSTELNRIEQNRTELNRTELLYLWSTFRISCTNIFQFISYPHLVASTPMQIVVQV